jgi:2,3,4,5-tetrahydropyridine-2,6-dicarboxylate N-succinyltransferase
MTRKAWGDGLATMRGGQPLDVFFPRPQLGAPPDGSDVDAGLLEMENEDELRGVAVRAVRATADLDEPVAGTADAYLRLHLLSHRMVRPNEVSLDRLFAGLPNVCWTTLGPVHPDDLAAVRLRCRASGTALQVGSVDKFPKMVDYVVPPAYGSPTGPGSGWAPTWPLVPRSCTKVSLTSMPALWEL